MLVGSHVGGRVYAYVCADVYRYLGGGVKEGNKTGLSVVVRHRR